MGEIALVDGRKCAVRWEKLRCRWEKLRSQMGEIAQPDGRNCATQMGEIALNCRKRFRRAKNSKKMPFLLPKTAVKWAF